MALRKKTGKPKPKRKTRTKTKDEPTRSKPKKHNGKAGDPYIRKLKPRVRHKPTPTRRPSVRARR